MVTKVVKSNHGRQSASCSASLGCCCRSTPGFAECGEIKRGKISRHTFAVPAVIAASDQSLLWNKTKDFISMQAPLGCSRDAFYEFTQQQGNEMIESVFSGKTFIVNLNLWSMRGQLIVVFSLDHLKTFFFLCVPLVIKIQTRANHSSMTYYGVITDLGLHRHLATLLLNAALLIPASWEEYRPGACWITGWEVVGEFSEKVFTLKCRGWIQPASNYDDLNSASRLQRTTQVIASVKAVTG